MKKKHCNDIKLNSFDDIYLVCVSQPKQGANRFNDESAYVGANGNKNVLKLCRKKRKRENLHTFGVGELCRMLGEKHTL